MQDLGYALACVAVPCIIGGVMFLLFDLWDRRRRRTKSDDTLPIIDYLI